MKNLLFLCIFLCASSLFAQKIELKGKVIDGDRKPIEAATIYLSSQKDSTLIDYTISNIKGDFSMPLKKIEYPTFMTISYLGFEDLTHKFDTISKSVDLGLMKLNPGSDLLDELVITTDAAPIRIKQDTLEFNAASFKVRPDATVKELLEQLPGVEVDTEGKIKVNGKEVNNVLVNGKPFFGTDGKVAIENLPKDIINKVQVTDTKSKEEKLTGAKSSGDAKTINFTIDEDKNKGLFGRFVAGYGSDDRYESSLLFNYFKNDFKISILGASNNINSTGFSQNEIFDNMSGGRNSYSSWSDDGSYSVNGLTFGGGKGIYQTDMIGVNYSDNWGKKNKVSLNYLFNEIENNNTNRTRIENLLPDNRYITESNSNIKSKNTNHSFNYDIEMQLDSLTTLTIVPNLKKGNSIARSEYTAETKNEFGEDLNKSNSTNITNTDNYSFENELLIARKFNKKGRSISLGLENKNTKRENNELKKQETYFFKSQMEDDIRNQKINSVNHIDEYMVNLVYREPIAPKQIFTFTYTSTFTNEYINRGTYDYNVTSESFNNFNNVLSYTNKLNGTKIAPKIGYQLSTEKLWLNLSTGTTLHNYDISSTYNNTKYLNERFDILPQVNMSVNYQLDKSKSIYTSYSYTETSPYLFQMLEYEDLSNPLYITSGNKNLLPTISHNIYFNFNNYDYQKRAGYYIYGSMSVNARDIGTNRSTDANFVSRSTYLNTENTYRFWSGINFNKSFKITDKNKLSFNAGANFSADSEKGILNNIAFSSENYTMGPRFNVTLDLDKKLTIQPTYAYEYNITNYENLNVNSANYFIHKAGLMVTSYWPKNVVFGSDVMYNYNSNVSSGFKKDFLLWNASLGYNFYDDRFLAKIKVYDILNQNQSVRRTISPTSIYDTEDIILKQYVMFSLTYKLEKFAGKKKSRLHTEE